MPTTLLIGAGMAGLTAARELAKQGHTVTVLDKGRGVGGRMATRRIDRSRIDHGAQYFTAKSPLFQSFTEELLTEGVAGIAPIANQGDAPLHYIGYNGMSAIAKYMAQSLHVITGERVIKIEKRTGSSNNGWRVVSETGTTYEADNLLITIPAPQALTLLQDSNIGADEVNMVALESIQYSPCITVMVVLSQQSLINKAEQWMQFDCGPIATIADNYLKGITPEQPSITIQAGAEFSQTHFDDDLMAVGHALINLVPQFIPAADILTYQVHRWRYSMADVRYPEPFLAANTPAPLLFGGDGFGSGNIEGAFLSGLAMAKSVSS